jgi:hypothetical protein
MMRRIAVAASVFVLLLFSTIHTEAQDSDLDRIPDAAAPQAASSQTTAAGDVVYLESYLTLSDLRDDLAVPLPPPQPPRWEARLFLDARLGWRLTDELIFFYIGRFNLDAQDGVAFPSHEDVRHDLREAYLAWDRGNGLFVQVGRINLRNGVALGFNPTDFFKTRAVVEPVSADPTVLREDRLGTLMLQGQKIWSHASLMVAIAPKFANNTAPYSDTNLPSFNPMFDRTNAHTRALVKASFDLFDDVNPELLAYDEAGQTRMGLNLTRGFGQTVIGYVEWAAARRSSLTHDAFADGFETGILPPASPIPVGYERSFSNDLAIGASYATRMGITFDLEFDYHQAGLSGTDWHDWFDAGAKDAGNPALLGQLWFLRGYAADQQEPLARDSMFLRADWQNAFIRDLALTGFVDTDLRDSSGLAQIAADYYISPQWTVGALADVNFGGRRSDFGSLPQNFSVLAKISKYF